MAPTKDTQAIDADDKTLMLKEALKCVNGNLDFEKLATKLGVANGEAMRKRFKRFFEKDDEPIQLKGSTLGGSEDGAVIPKAPRTPKPKASKSTSSSDDANTVNTMSKKRSSAEAESGEDESETKDGTSATTETPAKKPRAAAKAPRTPRTPKSPGFPKAPRTPKSAAGTKVSKNDIIASENGQELNGFGDVKEAETKKPRIGSPELQAKTDAAIKKAELVNGSAMGEPAKQAKRDAIEMEINADDEA